METYYNGECYFKASRADSRMKVEIIRTNQDKCTISAMCDVLNVPKSTFYYEIKANSNEEELVKEIIQIIDYSSSPKKDVLLVIKIEFVYQHIFESLDQLKPGLFDYINWYNNHRTHSSLGYETPINHRKLHLDKVV